MKVLCPYCGHHQKGDAEQCESCHGLFEPLSRTASQIAMGPWYLRNDAKPFLPGFSAAVLRRMIAAGRVKADTIIRGPITHQLWAYARHTPGVAHLIGLCHACGSAADPQASRCGSCGEAFATPTDRDLLGLPAMPTQQAIAERRRLNGPLCPVCANEAVDGGRCAACQRVFEPADRATRVTLGPWQLRDSKLPFVTGMSFVQVRQKIEAGEVDSGSILRGPTTNQYFSIIRHTPGIAHLVGKCFNCGGFVKSADSKCPNCAADLMVNVAPDRLGLMFRTDAEAAEAQQRLDAQIAAVNDPQVQKPVPIATPKKKPAAAPIAGGSPDTRSAPRPPAAASPPSAPTRAPAPAPDEADALAAQAASASPRARHVAVRRERSNSWVLLLTGVITLGTFGAIFYVVFQNSTARDDGEAEEDPAPVKVVDSADPQAANPVQTRDYNVLSARVDALTKQEQTTRIKPLVDAAVAQLAVVAKAWKEGQIAVAIAGFESLKEKIRAAESVVASRDRAAGLRGDADTASADAQDEEAPDIAPDHWRKAEATRSAAGESFKAEKYEDAEQGWRDSVAQYKASVAQVETAHNAERLRRTFDTKLIATFTKEQVDAGGGSLLADAAKLIARGEAEYKERKYTESVATYKQAHDLIPQIELAVKRAIGVHYWAIATGRLAADLLMQRAAGKPMTDEHRKAFAEAAENLRLDAAIASALPADANPPFADLAKSVVESASAAIASQRGSEAEISFRLGIQLRVMEQLLEADGDLMSPQDDAEIRRILSVMAKDAQTAVYPQLFLDRLDAIKAMLIIRPKFEAIRQARLAWAALRDDLAIFEKAMPLIPLSRHQP